MFNSSSVLLGLDGVVVESVRVGLDGTRTVVVTTAPQWVGVCGSCAVVSTRSEGWVNSTPRDNKIGRNRSNLVRRKHRWL